MKKNVKKVLSLLVVLALLMSALFTGCGGAKAPAAGEADSAPAESAEADAPKADAVKSTGNLPVMGDNLKYDPNKPVNDGKPITMKFWYWTNYDRFAKKWTAEYSKIHPNVKWELVNAAYEDYFKKLPVALQSGTGPDIFAVHNQFTDVLVPNMSSYEEGGITLDELRADFRQVDAHQIKGKVYYIDFGLMTAGIFYNKQMWKDAGLTEDDYPKTWDELRAIAKKLTKRDGSGQVSIQGFSLNTYSQYLWIAMQYQQGKFLFDEAGKKAMVNTPEGKKAAQFIYDIYFTDKVADVKFPEMFNALGNGQAAMIYSWAWIGNYMKDNYPDLEYGFFKLPTFDGSTPPGYERNNGESTWGVPAKAKSQQKAVAFDFIRYTLANDDMLIDFDTDFKIAPSKISLDKRPEILNDPVLKVEAEMLDRTIWPGPAPDAYYTGLIKYLGDAIVINKTPIDEALTKAEEVINKDMSGIDFTAVERQYKYAKELN